MLLAMNMVYLESKESAPWQGRIVAGSRPPLRDSPRIVRNEFKVFLSFKFHPMQRHLITELHLVLQSFYIYETKRRYTICHRAWNPYRGQESKIKNQEQESRINRCSSSQIIREVY